MDGFLDPHCLSWCHHLTALTNSCWQCRDGRRLECVLMTEGPRRTVCLSTQVGCGMGCVFCASGLKGVERNLSADEILEQVLRLRNLLPAEETRNAHCRHGNGRELGESRQSDRCARSTLLGRQRAWDQPAARNNFDRGAARENLEACCTRSAISFGRLAPCTDRGIA